MLPEDLQDTFCFAFPALEHLWVFKNSGCVLVQGCGDLFALSAGSASCKSFFNCSCFYALMSCHLNFGQNSQIIFHSQKSRKGLGKLVENTFSECLQHSVLPKQPLVICKSCTMGCSPPNSKFTYIDCRAYTHFLLVSLAIIKQ